MHAGARRRAGGCGPTGRTTDDTTIRPPLSSFEIEAQCGPVAAPGGQNGRNGHAGESARAAAMVRHDDTIKYYYVDGNATQAGPVFLPELQTMCDRELHPNPTLAPHQN